MAESGRPAVLYGIQPYMFEPESDPDDEETPAEETQMRMEQDVSEWCLCGKCEKMATEPENICCREIEQVTRRMQQLEVTPSCMVDHPGMDPVCLNVFSLQNAFNIYRADYGPLRLRGVQHRYRFLAYRSFVSWCWGFLGRKVRVVIPSCVVLRIRREFPDAQGSYVGFRPPID
ncbi:P2X purinoceptor 7-like [Carassius auratus]|uniref:P2X purinoceptor 7-like n=1 Tax=Carassius auratus TaxID=7957 RepID=A0A6P6NBW8_CARAU|nr:P2X purinoceptor 7-like [Carassius auratus]XP_026133821.1 P2X purinoceptor 7-like [Carassius auratus]XP_052464933.1 P2X purinoceptor 7-like [Carassius gibelio]